MFSIAKILTGLTWSNVAGWGGSFLAYCFRHWKEVLMCLMSVVIVYQVGQTRHYHKLYDNCQSLRKEDKKNYETAQKDAASKNKREVAAAEDKWKGVADTTKKVYDEKLKNAYAAVSRYANGVRSQAAPRPTSNGSLPQAANAPDGSDGPGKGALVPVTTGDLNVCAENTVKAEQWQEWWKGVVANWPKAQ